MKMPKQTILAKLSKQLFPNSIAKRVRRLEALAELRSLPTIDPCFNCGRLVLAGKCCDGPHTARGAIKILEARIKCLEDKEIK